MNAPSTAHLVTSYVQGNCSRRMALNCFLSIFADGLPPASYCCFHSASAQLKQNRAVPAALAKELACSSVGWSLILCALIIPVFPRKLQGLRQFFICIVASVGNGASCF